MKLYLFIFLPAVNSTLLIHKMGALVAKKLVNWQSLQERLDLYAVYQLIHLYQQNIGPLPTCSYEQQYRVVHQAIEKQVISVCFTTEQSTIEASLFVN